MHIIPIAKQKCSQNCRTGGNPLVCGPYESAEGLLCALVNNIQQNRRYDGHMCYCRPCPECHGVWIPENSCWGNTCADCKLFPPGTEHRPNIPNNTSEIEEFLARNAAARARDHWMCVRRFVYLRAAALWWLEQAMRPTAENRAPPGRLAAFAEDF